MTVQQVQPQAKAPVIVHDPVFINTTWGAVSVYGHEIVSKKDLLILGHCLGLPDFSAENGDHGVRMVMFRDDNRPYEIKSEKKDGKQVNVKVPLMASCVPDAQAIIVNLEHTFLMSFEEAAKENEHSSVRACFHRNLILNYLHEIHHMERLHKVGMAELSAAEKDEMEKDAQEWALAQLFELAKTRDIEPAHHAESSYLSNALMALLLEEKDDWSKNQRHMLENNIMYSFPAEAGKHEGLTLMSFKGICTLMAGADPNDPEWKQPTIQNATTSSAELTENITKVMAPHEPAVSTLNGAFSEPISAMEDAEIMDMIDPNMIAYENNYYSTTIVPWGEEDDTPASTMMPQGGQPVMAPVTQVTQPTPVMVYPRTGLTPEQTRDVVFGVFGKIYNHIFTHCGQLLNSDIGFQTPEAVSALPIELTPLEKSIVVKCDCLDVNGRWCPNMPTVGGLRGFVMKNSKLPAYKLYINSDGYEAVRLLLPQNPAKNSKPAQQAKIGSRIMYVIDGVDKGDYNEGSKFFFKCIDYVWQAC